MEQHTPVDSQTRAPRKGWLVALIVALFATCAGAGTAVYLGARGMLRAVTPSLAPPSVTVLRATPAVVTSMRELALLQTSSFHIERVIDLRDKQSYLFGLVEAEDALLLVAAGDVHAGVNLELLRDEDVRVDPATRTVRLQLPEPVVFSASLDNEATYVHTRRTDLAARRHEQLETRARREAERTLREAALQAGILERAREGAERTVRSLLHSLGYQVVELTFRAE